MSRKLLFGFTASAVGFVILVACAPAATPGPMEAPALQQPPLPVEAPSPPQARPPQPPEGQAAVLYRTGLEEVSSPSQRSNRMIVKNAEIKLLVGDSDVAIDGVTQVIVDVGGYLISSRMWYQEWGGRHYKFATLTFGVPAEEFERSLRRLRQLAIRVVDETSTGQDVTEEFVDLRSQLESLEATRARIMRFLDRAGTVEEALTVNEQLAAVEQQIEQVQGRINYLADRSAYSTITVSLEPDLPEVVATVTPTATPTSTPEPWDPGVTFTEAKRAVASAYQAIADVLIWFGVVILPILGPPILIVWIVWRLTRGKPSHSQGEAEDGG